MEKNMNRVLEYIEHNLSDELKSKDVSNMYHYSNSQFNRIFLSEMGQSVTKYIKLRRIIRSSKNLVLGNDSITQLAFAYGFTNIDTYIRSFKSIYGITPTEYRKVKKLELEHSKRSR